MSEIFPTLVSVHEGLAVREHRYVKDSRRLLESLLVEGSVDQQTQDSDQHRKEALQINIE